MNAPEENVKQMVAVSPDPCRFRTGRVVLVVEGALLVGLGAWGLLANQSTTQADPTGASVALLHLTTGHASLLLLTGVLAVAGACNRRFARLIAGAQAVGYLLLFAIGTVAAARDTPTALGFDTADAVLHGALTALGLGLSMWLAGQALEGLWWVPRRSGRQQPREPQRRTR